MKNKINPILNFGLITLFTMVSALVQADTFNEGVDYTRLPQPGKVEQPGKIEVREFFSFACPHCFTLEGYTKDWKKTLADDVNFVMTPAAFRKDWEPLARAYYIAESLDKLDTIKPKLFETIHVKKKPMDTEENLATFFADYGVNEADFKKLYNSFSIRVKEKQGMALAKAYQLRGVPAMVVNGKYMVNSQTGKTYDHLLKVANFLIEKERAAGATAAK
ncbi:MAG: thiol:disulfide interchange protein DsbA/DsbL [Ketobacter sp.]|uniref:thiol:disulfide interchange protein DsbA/DsbL n=1 Tax=Ketobacter sp. MCCC 1A13808 TaxID=2602738 RepID=UPI0018DE3A85|nr:thiol:disulfide interchange protein DsbA/DsbL [Ketobacter sp. MCCC 1A13808]